MFVFMSETGWGCLRLSVKFWGHGYSGLKYVGTCSLFLFSGKVCVRLRLIFPEALIEFNSEPRFRTSLVGRF